MRLLPIGPACPGPAAGAGAGHCCLLQRRRISPSAVDQAGAAAAQAQRREHPAPAGQDAPAQGSQGLARRRLRGEGLRGAAGRAHRRASMRRPTTCSPGSTTLGIVDPSARPTAPSSQELTAASLELQATVKAKTAYTLSKLDQMLGDAPRSAPKPAPAPPTQGQTRRAAEGSSSAAAAAPPKPAVRQARPPQSSGWSTKTTEHATARAATSPSCSPRRARQAVPPLTPEEEGYTIQEIMAASEGLFGKVSANLGSVIEHLFRKSGRPTGYVLGTEGGGAFLAGVRYGKGTLYMRGGGTQKIFWHGPSLGTDVGAEGSKTLFLIYKLQCARRALRQLHRHRRLGLSRRRRRRHAGHQRHASSWRRSAPASACGSAPTSATSASRRRRPGIRSERRQVTR